MKNKHYFLFFIIVCIFLGFACVSQDTTEKANTSKEQVTIEKNEAVEETQTQKDEESKEVIKTETKTTIKAPQSVAGSVFFSPYQIKTNLGESLTANIHIHSGGQKVAAFGFTVLYDTKYLELENNKGKDGFEAGPQGFLAVTNTSKAGEAVIAGFDTVGKGPGEDLDFLKVYFKSKSKGVTLCEIKVKNLVDESAGVIGTPQGAQLEISIQ